MTNISIQEKIIEDLKGLNKLEDQEALDDVVQALSKRYDISEVMVEKAIAEWSAGKTGENNETEEEG